MDEPEKAVIELEPEAATEIPKAPEVPTREDLKSKGWSASELEAAEKRGMIQKPEEKKKEEPKVEVKKEEEKKPEVKKSTIPDFSMTPEQEKVFLETFGPGTPQHGTYMRMKSERRARQAAEARIRELEALVEQSKQKQPEVKKEVDENGQEVDPDDKPLTPKMLREMREKEVEETLRLQEEQHKRAQAVAEAQKEQEDYARAIYPDFDETVKLAKEVITNLDGLVQDEGDREEILELFQQMKHKATNADKLGLNSFNAARIAYKIGSFHPDKGKTAKAEETDGKQPTDPKKDNGNLTPEQMKRIEANTQRRSSSASLPGSGSKRVVSVDEIGLKELNEMTFEKRSAFKEKYPERYAKILRG